jgi:hypothetical protein
LLGNRRSIFRFDDFVSTELILFIGASILSGERLFWRDGDCLGEKRGYYDAEATTEDVGNDIVETSQTWARKVEA